MLVITSKEFQKNQPNYLEQADDGEKIVVKGVGEKDYKIVPTDKDDALMTKEEFYAMVDKSIAQIEQGKVRTKNKGESFEEFFERLFPDV